MPPSVIDLGKLKAVNAKAIAAIRHGVESGVLAIVKDAALIASNSTIIKKRTGAMKAGWGYRLITGRPNRTTGQLRNTVLHAKFQEWGTGVFGPKRSPYWIEAKNAKCLRFFAADGTLVFRRRVLHYGVHPRYIGQAALFGRQAMFFGADHERNIRVLTRWINGELARVK